jgi:hypothetical protein
MKAMCRRLANDGFPIPFFATPESHNTPRAVSRPGGVLYSRWSWVINCFLPAIPFLHSGFELAEQYPINTGLDFTVDQLKRLPSEKLPLFSEYGYDWLSPDQFLDWISAVARLRQKYADIIVNPEPHSFVMLNENNEHIIAFARVDIENKRRVAIIANSDFAKDQSVVVKIETEKKHLIDLLGGTKVDVNDHHLSTTLTPGQCLVFEY